MAHDRKPLDPKIKERYAYVVGLGLTGDGAAGAGEISTATGELGALWVMLRSRRHGIRPWRRSASARP